MAEVLGAPLQSSRLGEVCSGFCWALDLLASGAQPIRPFSGSPSCPGCLTPDPTCLCRDMDSQNMPLALQQALSASGVSPV